MMLRTAVESWSPLEVKMLLHFHSIAAPFEGIAYPAQQEALEGFKNLGLVEPAPWGWQATAQGSCIALAICACAGAILQSQNWTLAP